MTVLNLTLEERERRAYIEGRTAEAELLSAAIEGERSARAEIDELKSEVSKADDEIGKLTSELDDKGVEIVDLEDKLGLADETINELRAENEQLQAKVLELEQPLA